ncbi:hypothetical protein B0H17DRAFT_1208150 [Mycena rosella]|uniref:Uncharacterized protein n=1 Tax=Mycena rosella TaxID=1033263 RepID=A0AAD7D561_MYCRO|nr:hypothetical protein B0H17DRAFT_1208150 [Mycena rosella]
MPGATNTLEAVEEERYAEAEPPNPEDVVLWMPNELTKPERARGCVKGLGEKEATLRGSQCTNTPDSLRDLLLSKRQLILYCNDHLVGQEQNTCSNMLVGQAGDRIDAVTIKYRRPWNTLRSLKGDAWYIKLDEEQEADARAQQWLAQIGSRHKRQKNAPMLSSKAKMFSWIWTVRGGSGEDEEALTIVDWSKVLVRKNRWVEEVRLLREEMKQVMRLLAWKAAWWEAQQATWGDQSLPEVVAGLDTYTVWQALLHRGIAARFKLGWDTSSSGIVQAAVREDVLLAESMAWFERATRGGEETEAE